VLALYFLRTWRLTVTLCVMPPPVPVIVNVKPPFLVAEFVATDSVDESEDGTFTGFGLNVPVELLGSPLRLKPTGPAKPLLGASEIE
jgi:hypothetical protein